jgi:hypothetical protein
MYLNGALIYVFNSMVGMTNSAVSILRIKTNTLIDRLDTGLLLWDQFTVTRGMPTPEELENSNIHQLEDLLALITKAKEAYKNHMYVSLLIFPLLRFFPVPPLQRWEAKRGGEKQGKKQA